MPNLNIPVTNDLLAEINYAARKQGLTQKVWLTEKLEELVTRERKERENGQQP
jgi:hypothetical protein